MTEEIKILYVDNKMGSFNKGGTEHIYSIDWDSKDLKPVRTRKLKGILDLPKDFSEDWVYVFAVDPTLEVSRQFRKEFKRLKIINCHGGHTVTTDSYPIRVSEEIPENLRRYVTAFQYSNIVHNSIASRSLRVNDMNGWIFGGFRSRIVTDYIAKKPSGKLYVLCAPSGYGKSTISNHISHLCVKIIPKITTRPYRPGSNEMLSGAILSVSPKVFISEANQGEIVGSHLYHEQRYGIRKKDIESVFLKEVDAHVWDTCDPETALGLKRMFPDIVKVVGIFPGRSLVGIGLEKRKIQASEPVITLATSTSELDRIIEKNEQLVRTTNQRLDRAFVELKNYLPFIPSFDHLLNAGNVRDNVLQMLEIIMRDKR